MGSKYQRIMKTKSLLFLMLMGLSSFAQVTVDSTSIITPGNTRYMANDDMPASTISQGTASATAQSWDFVDLVAVNVDTMNFVTPSGALYPPTISGANLSLDFDFDDMTMHLRNDANGLYILEFVGPFGSIPVSETIANFPMTYGSNFSWSFTIDTVMINTFMPMPGADIVRYKKDTFNISEVDAFGTATTPLGTFDVLRLTSEASSTDSIWIKAFQTSHQVQTVGTTFDPDSLTISILDTVFFTGLGYHDVTEVDEATYLANGTTSNGGFTYLSDTFHVFTEPGTYYYVCAPHASMGMKGMITVIDDWTLFQNSNIDGEPTYNFWTDNANDAGMPLVTLYTTSGGMITSADFLNTGGAAPAASWNCVESACIDPADGSGMYTTLSDCQNVCLGSSVDESVNPFNVYPNPAKESITFNIEGSATLKIYSLVGKLLIEQNIKERQSISINEFSPGIYQYQLNSSMGTSTGKFQIIK